MSHHTGDHGASTTHSTGRRATMGGSRDGRAPHSPFGRGGAGRGREGAAGHSSRDSASPSPSLAVRLMQVAGEFELERKRERQRADSQIASLEEDNRTLDRKVWSQAKQIEALTRKVGQLQQEVQRERQSAAAAAAAGAAGGTVSPGDAQSSLLEARFLLAEQALLIQHLRNSVQQAGDGSRSADFVGTDAGVGSPSVLPPDEGAPFDASLAAFRSACVLASDSEVRAMLKPGHGRVLRVELGVAAAEGARVPTKEALMAAAELGDAAQVDAILSPSPLRTGASDALAATLGHAVLAAARGGHLDIIKQLVARGGLVGMRTVEDGRACTALHLAAEHGHEDVVRFLVSKATATATAAGGSDAAPSPLTSVDVDDGDATQRTALHVAAVNNHSAVVKFLLLNGANPDAPDAAGSVPLVSARAAGTTSCVRLLSDNNMLFWNSSVRANKEYNEKRFEEAMASYSKALRLAPECSMTTSSRDLATLHYNRARAAYRLGQHCRAVEDCTAALDKDESYRNALAQRAECYMSLFDFDRAVRDFQALLDADPSDRQWARRLLDAKAMRDMTHYQVLGIARIAAADAIKKAYRQHCLKWHPDKHHACAEDQQRATTAFRRINEANEILSDSYKRMVYDMEIRNMPAGGIQSDGFDRWYQKERERESERAAECQRLRKREEQRVLARNTERDAAAAAGAAWLAALANHRRRIAEHGRELADKQAQERHAATTRARAAVAAAEEHVRAVEAQRETATKRLNHVRRRVDDARSEAASAAVAAEAGESSGSEGDDDGDAADGDAGDSARDGGHAGGGSREGHRSGARLGIRPGLVSERSALFKRREERQSAYFEGPGDVERRSAIQRAKSLARRAEAEKQKELERLRKQQARDLQFKQATSKVLQLERERAERLQAERAQMHRREAEFKRQVERELDGHTPAPGLSSDDILLSGSDGDSRPGTPFAGSESEFFDSGGMSPTVGDSFTNSGLGDILDDDDDDSSGHESALMDDEDSLDAAAVAAVAAKGLSGGDGSEDRVMAEVERLYRQERTRVATSDAVPGHVDRSSSASARARAGAAATAAW